MSHQTCTWCYFPIITRELKYSLEVDGEIFCSKHCADGYAKDPTRDSHGYPVPRASGTSTTEHGESWCTWAVFDNDDITDELCESEDPAELGTSLTGWDYSYGGPGRSFAQAPYAQRGKYHTLVRQSGGLDI